LYWIQDLHDVWAKAHPDVLSSYEQELLPIQAMSKTVHTSARVGMWRVPLHVRDQESFVVAASASALQSLRRIGAIPG